MPSIRTAISVTDQAAVDTSVLVAAHVRSHEHRSIAAPAAAEATHVIGQVVAETWSVLRRHFQLPATDVERALRRYVEGRQLVVAPAEAYRDVLDHGAGFRLAGNVHDFVIVVTARLAGLKLSTFDGGMQRLATDTVRHLS